MAPIAVFRGQYIPRIIALNLLARYGLRKGVILLLTLLYVFRLPARSFASLFCCTGLIKLPPPPLKITHGCNQMNVTAVDYITQYFAVNRSGCQIWRRFA